MKINLFEDFDKAYCDKFWIEGSCRECPIGRNKVRDMCKWYDAFPRKGSVYLNDLLNIADNKEKALELILEYKLKNK